MQANWKKPWTVLFWVFSRDEFTPEEGAGPESASRFGPHGFWGWLFEPEEFIEEPEIQINKPRFGDRGFFSWLFGSDRQSQMDVEDSSERSQNIDNNRKNIAK